MGFTANDVINIAKEFGYENLYIESRKLLEKYTNHYLEWYSYNKKSGYLDTSYNNDVVLRSLSMAFYVLARVNDPNKVHLLPLKFKAGMRYADTDMVLKPQSWNIHLPPLTDNYSISYRIKEKEDSILEACEPYLNELVEEINLEITKGFHVQTLFSEFAISPQHTTSAAFSDDKSLHVRSYYFFDKVDSALKLFELQGL